MYDKQRFLTMLAAGMCSKARKGTELPSLYLAAGLQKGAESVDAELIIHTGDVSIALPTWDTTTYPYAVAGFWSGKWWMELFKIPPYIGYKKVGFDHAYSLYPGYATDEDTYSMVYWVVDGAWVLNKESSLQYGGQITDVSRDQQLDTDSYHMWANFDIEIRDDVDAAKTSEILNVR